VRGVLRLRKTDVSIGVRYLLRVLKERGRTKVEMDSLGPSRRRVNGRAFGRGIVAVEPLH